MRYEDENIWLTQKIMATLYDVGLPTINEHIKKIYADSELEESATIRNFRIVQTDLTLISICWNLFVRRTDEVQASWKGNENTW